MRRYAWFPIPALLASALVFSCGSDGPSFEPPPAPARGLQLRMTPFDIQSNHEREIFQARRLESDEDLYVNRIEVKMPEGSHHFILYVADPERQDIKEGTRQFFNSDDPLFAELKFGAREGSFVLGSQEPYLNMQFPVGVAFRLRAQQWLIFNSHFINLDGSHPIRGEVALNLHTIPESDVRHLARPIFENNPLILVLPGETRTTEYVWTPDRDIQLLSLTSHMHKRAIDFTARLIEGGQKVDPPLMSTQTWDHPAVRYFDPPLPISEGQGVNFSCTHTNDKSIPLIFGFTSDDEMCIMIGFYYAESDRLSLH
ncbi:MAG: hypothetical protein HYT87_07025 [Nitrospirae bacterium]|nr:hypothetical protein [Nitrospirota bacterium]